MVPGSTAGLTHNFTPFLDQRPGVPAGERLKAIAGSHGSGVFRFASAGEVRVELQRADGRPVPGFTLEDAAPLVGDKVEGEVSWRSNARLATLAGQPVRLRSVMWDAGLHSLQLTAT
jgi:hypothetical protein